MTPSILSMYPEELRQVLESYGEKPYRAAQLYSWLHEKAAASYAEMTNLPKALREKLERDYPLHPLRIVKELRSRRDGTRKYLFALEDGNVIESVRMPYEHGISVCVSSQVGCRMGCRFCASTLDGLVRSLTAAEMLEQVYGIRRESGERVSHVVIMGSGEPLENYDEVVRFIRILSNSWEYQTEQPNALQNSREDQPNALQNSKEGQPNALQNTKAEQPDSIQMIKKGKQTHPQAAQISQRNITLSTCGLMPAILKLAEENLAITLAVSLHAPNDEKRKKLMPVANRYPLRELIPACRTYFQKTGRRLTFEYALIENENDSPGDAAELASLLKGLHAHVNLIPVNAVKERNLRRPSSSRVMKFQKELEKYGINVTIRREMGADISGACGQLRKSYTETDQENGE